jgi:hypothetical protein
MATPALRHRENILKRKGSHHLSSAAPQVNAGFYEIKIFLFAE